MNPEVKAAWLEALRSGRYEQGRSQLRNDRETDGVVRFCCLGVLCDLHSKGGEGHWGQPEVSGWTRYYSRGEDARGADLPQRVMLWAGLDSSDPILPGTLTDHGVTGTGRNQSCSEVNDGCYGRIRSFAEIADLIERL